MTEGPAPAQESFENVGPAPPAYRPKLSSGGDDQRLKVFISYSRADLDFADQLDACLELTGFDSTLDRQGIHGGEEWQSRLGNLIRDADTIVFVLSPTSAVSKVCAWEVEEAHRFGKRIIPICCRALDGAAPPERLSQLNYIFFYPEQKAPGSGFGTGLAKLVDALSTDLDWLREHTRLLQRANEWQTGGKLANRLLSGTDIAAAKAWAARRPKNAPELSPLHLEYIRASEHEEEARLNTERQKLRDMAAAQEERAKALTAAENALKEAAEAQRRRAVVRNTAMASVTAVALVAVYFWTQAEKGRDSIAYLLNNARELITTVSQRYQFKEDEYKVAVDLFKKGDELGDPAATFMLGIAYENGWSVAQDAATALSLYEKSAAKNHARAVYTLAEMYEAGSDVPKNPDKARALFEKAAELADADTLASLAQRYENGDGVQQNTTRARDLYEKAAHRGSLYAMGWLSRTYFEGQGVVKDADLGRKWLEDAAGKGDASAMRQLGEIFETGDLLPQSMEKAVVWYTKAAEKDDTTAMRRLALIYDTGKGLAAEPETANQWFEKIVAKEGASAMTDIGVQYENGDGVTKSYTKAREWYQRAADLADTRAMNFLAEIIIRGKDGTPPDPQQAIKLLEKSAAIGNANAMLRLGGIYHVGDGVEVDGKEALGWYEQAAQKDQTSAMVNIGVLYQYGLGLERNPAKAREWYEKAAAKDDPEGLMRIGSLYEAGTGVEMSYSEARARYEKAAEQQNTNGIISLGVLAYFGRGEPRDFDKARQKFEEAGQLGDSRALAFLGIMSRNGQGGPRDYIKARTYFEQALAMEDGTAASSLAWLYAEGKGVDRDFAKARAYMDKADLFNYDDIRISRERMDIDELEANGDLAAAFARQTALTVPTEAEDMKLFGKPQDNTTTEIDRQARLAILMGAYEKALSICDEAAGRLPEEYRPQLQKANALMFLNRTDEAKAIFAAGKGQLYAGRAYQSWEMSVEEDFERFRTAGHSHPLMDEVAADLGIAK